MISSDKIDLSGVVFIDDLLQLTFPLFEIGTAHGAAQLLREANNTPSDVMHKHNYEQNMQETVVHLQHESHGALRTNASTMTLSHRAKTSLCYAQHRRCQHT